MLFLVYKIMGRMRGIYIMDITREKRVKNKVDFWAHLYKGS